MTDLLQKPAPNVPARQMARLGWWHRLIHGLLLAGHPDHPPPPPISEAPPPIQMLTSLLEDHRSQFAAAARSLSSDYKGGYWMMYLLAPIAVMTAAAASVFGHFGPLLSGIELFVVLMILGLYIAMRQGQWQEGWIRARRTAEHLRYLPLIAPFVADPRANWYEQFAARRGSRLTVDPELTRVCAWLGGGGAVGKLRLDDPQFVAGYVKYVDDTLAQQIQYHAGKAAMEHALARRIGGMSVGFFGITILCTALLFLEALTGWFGFQGRILSHYLRFLATGLPALGGGLRGLLAQGESHRVAAISEGMSIRLAQLRAELRAIPAGTNHVDDLENVVWNALQELLSEADTWMRLQESAELSVAS